jgi:flagellar basal-body rod protein FlgB
MSGIDPLFGIHAQALQLQRQRMELIAGNLANADTPGFKARDLDFRQVLAAAQSGADLQRTHAQHLSSASGGLSGDPLNGPQYRLPVQPSVDGNTVDVQIEQAQFADAALRYQAGLGFIDSRMKGLMSALTGQ